VTVRRRQADALLGHPACYSVVRAPAWTAAIITVAVPVAVARHRRG
jgi:hypothetical protein